MAKKDKKKVSKIKTKKKIWYKILAPKSFGQREIGESYLNTLESAIGRTLKVNLKELTGSMRDQNVYVSFRIVKADGNILHTETIGYRLTPAHVKRAVRKNSARLDDYFIAKSKDGKNLIVKPLVVTLNRVQRLVKTNLRKKLQELLAEELSNLSLENFVANLVGNKIQHGIKKLLHKISPVKEVSIRELKVCSSKSSTESSSQQPTAQKEAKNGTRVEEVKAEEQSQAKKEIAEEQKAENSV